MSIFVYDLVGHMRRDTRAREKILSTMSNVEKVHKEYRQHKASRSETAKAMGDAVVACNFNVGLLMPYFFNNFRDMHPMSLLDRPYMFTMTCLAPDSVTVLMSGRQVGKCVDADTDISTDAGVMTLRELFDEGVPDQPTSSATDSRQSCQVKRSMVTSSLEFSAITDSSSVSG